MGSGTSNDSAARARLIEAAVDLFSRRGYTATTVREIVEAAGVTKPTLYYYFRNKEAIYLAIMEEALGEFEALVDALLASPGSPWERIRGLCLEVFAELETRLPLVRLVYAMHCASHSDVPFFDFERYHRKFEEAILALLWESSRAGEIRPLPVDDVGFGVAALFHATLETLLWHPERTVGRETLGRLLDLFYQGIHRQGDVEVGPG